MMTSWKPAILAVLLGLSPLGLAAEGARTITVTGEGRVEVAPDMATIRLGVGEQAPEAKAAMDAVSEKMTAVLARLADEGVEPRDVQTQSLRLNPVWSHRGGQDTPPEITGFEAQNVVMVRVRDLDRLGDVLDAVLSDGANRFDGLSFGVADPDASLDEARRQAVKSALEKATLYAEAAGVSLGSVMSITEAGGARPVPQMMAARDMAMESMPVAAGEVSLSASVTVVLGIAD